MPPPVQHQLEAAAAVGARRRAGWPHHGPPYIAAMTAPALPAADVVAAIAADAQAAAAAPFVDLAAA